MGRWKGKGIHSMIVDRKEFAELQQKQNTVLIGFTTMQLYKDEGLFFDNEGIYYRYEALDPRYENVSVLTIKETKRCSFLILNNNRAVAIKKARKKLLIP